jgi:CheY-like chemotaxis protein
MDAAIVDRIFDPFFTTKDPGKGTGLGLAVVHGIVKEHNGAIAVFSRPGMGTTFDIFFPGLSLDSVLLSGGSSAAAPAGQGQRILFVDDEHVLVMLAEKLLSRLGYNCTTRTDPLDARALLQQDASAFDVVLTDMTMPVMNGAELAREVSRLRPGLPVVLVTGQGAALSAMEMRDSGISGVLEKPFDAASLSKAVQLALTT